MGNINRINQKIYTSLDEMVLQANKWHQNKETIVFTNGCFDILHQGHCNYLARAAQLGTKLILGLNSNQSVKNLKGETRPIVDEEDRAFVLASLWFIDAVVLFNEETPLQLITHIKPHYLVKGGDYEAKKVVGYQEVIQNKGKVVILPFIAGKSTTNIIDKIRKL